MRTRLISLAVISLGLAACSSSGPMHHAATSATPAESKMAHASASVMPSMHESGSMAHMTTGSVAIATGSSQLGPVLFDGNGQAVYTFGPDTSARSTCYGTCAAAWPPVLTHGAPHAEASAQSALLGTTRRTDGSLQVTYGGHPLYHYAHEGQHVVTCHNMTSDGGLWLAVTASGAPART